MAGQYAQIYVREVALAGTASRGGPAADRVVLFVHGAGTPAEVTFDVPYKDYSWMAYLAKAGFDVFSMDMTGYGRSTRPAAMNDPCNFSKEQQGQFVPKLIPAPCAPSHPTPITTMGSDWDDVGAVIDHLKSATRRGQSFARRMVARRPARGRLCSAQPGEGGTPGCAGACLYSRVAARSA